MDYHALVHLFHILIVGGLFLYVGINRDKIYKPFLEDFEKNNKSFIEAHLDLENFIDKTY